MILAGIIMAEAASIYGDKNAVQSQSYGPESRGGASKAEVVISDDAIDYPKATAIDCMLAMTQEACTKYHDDIKDDGILLVDTELVHELPKGKFKIYEFPIIETAREELGKVIVANIISLGLMTALTKIVSEKAITDAVLSRVPKPFLELNEKALKIGFERAKELKEKK